MTIAAGHSAKTQQQVMQFNWVFGSWASYFDSYDFAPNSPANSRPVFYLTSSSPTSQYLKICAENACGCSSYYGKYFYAKTCGGGGGMLMSISPNPTSGETYITLESEIDGTSIETADDDIEWEMEVYTQNQFLKSKQEKIHGRTTTLNTSGWKEGAYIVRAKHGDEIITGKIIIKSK